MKNFTFSECHIRLEKMLYTQEGKQAPTMVKYKWKSLHYYEKLEEQHFNIYIFNYKRKEKAQCNTIKKHHKE